MTNRIFRNTFITSGIILVVTIFIFMIIMNSHFEKDLLTEMKVEADLVEMGLVNSGDSYLEALDNDSDIRVTWIDTDGRVLYDNTADAATMDNHRERNEVVSAINSGYGEAVRYSTTLLRKTAYYAKKLQDGTVLRISCEYQGAGALFVSVLQPLIYAVVLLIIFIYLVSYFTAKKIVEPINKIDLEKGTISGKKGSYEEIEPLLNRINKQNREIEKNIAQIKKEHENRENFRREFTSNVSHELKTPLTSISGISEMMINGIIAENDIKPFAENIHSEAERLINLVNDIILISKLEEKDLPYQKEEVDIVSIAKNVEKRLEVQSSKNNIQFKLCVVDVNGVPYTDSYSFPAIKLIGVSGMLEEMIYNLCDNSIKYSRPNGKIDLVIKEYDSYIEIIVDDNGIGIPDEEKSRVFERFYRVDKSRSKSVGGTGLGLSIVKHIVTYHNGNIYVDKKKTEGTRIVAKFNKS